MHQYLKSFSSVLTNRVNSFFGKETLNEKKLETSFNAACNADKNLMQLAADLELEPADLYLLVLSVVPCFSPGSLDILKLQNETTGQRFAEFGGTQDESSVILLPTIDTLIFSLCGNDEKRRIQFLSRFTPDHILFRSGHINLVNKSTALPFSASALKASDDLLYFLLTGKQYSPEFSAEFPAKKITTKQEWTDLILEEDTLQQITEIKSWIIYYHELYHQLNTKGKFKPGYRCLFYGPPGTGKTFTAALLGKYTGLDVYRIDLSLTVSKYIGETEKNLSKIFDRAQKKNWILFFDEADALFGKRTNISNSHDKYANQEVSYLLQRVEDYPGVVILATNLKANIDEAFARRFQSIISFQMPQANQRHDIWKNNFPETSTFEKAIKLEEIARRYELSGGSIMNIIQYSCLKALERGKDSIMLSDIETGIKRELRKEGKSI